MSVNASKEILPGEKAMERFVEDYQKRRLTERVDIMTAINILMSQGFDEDDLLDEITKVFYVDLDAFYDIVISN